MRLQDLGTSPEKLLIILKSLNPSKAAGIDIFLSCKIAKIKPLLKKGSETDLQKYRLISSSPCYQNIMKEVFMIKQRNFSARTNLYAGFSGVFQKLL